MTARAAPSAKYGHVRCCVIKHGDEPRSFFAMPSLPQPVTPTGVYLPILWPSHKSMRCARRSQRSGSADPKIKHLHP